MGTEHADFRTNSVSKTHKKYSSNAVCTGSSVWNFLDMGSQGRRPILLAAPLPENTRGSGPEFPSVSSNCRSTFQNFSSSFMPPLPFLLWW